ncbi:MAG: hypothetical protein EOP29_20845 [Rhodococcus sp. (in: high G+C Gram-positive bacteria)]|nr:MAG: hypothetical protein EOP29_20845 [Rhodococcus sp. (in: high G+C Gram-positive bacteria)]
MKSSSMILSSTKTINSRDFVRSPCCSVSSAMMPSSTNPVFSV